MPSSTASTSKVVLRSLYRSLLRSSKPFSPPSPLASTYASLIHRSGISHDWEGCIQKLDRNRRLRREIVDVDDESSTSSGDGSGHISNVRRRENNIPKSWAQNLSKSYKELQQEYNVRKEYLQQRFGLDEAEDDNWDDDGDFTMNMQHYEEESPDPKYILFRQLLQELFTSNDGTNKANMKQASKWPKEWNATEEGYYESSVQSIPLMRFPSLIVNDGGLSIRDLIRKEFRAPTVEERLLQGKEKQEKEDESGRIYPSSSYIDTDIRTQTAFYTLMELNRKLAWAAMIGFPATASSPSSAEKRRRLVQAAKGVSAFPSNNTVEQDEEEVSEDEGINTDVETVSDEESSSQTTTPSQLECGTYLIAHPLMTGYFEKTVIVILDHTEESSSANSAKTEEGGNENGGGTYGLIINRLALQPEKEAESSRRQLDIMRENWEKEKKSKLGEEASETLKSSSISGSTDEEDSATATQSVTVESALQSSTTIKGTSHNALRPISLAQAINSENLPESVLDAFGDSTVRDGGPVQFSLQMLHRKQNVVKDNNDNGENKEQTEAESELNDVGGTVLESDYNTDKATTDSEDTTFFGGDLVKASHSVLAGRSDADDYSFVIGAACWSPGQLDHEIKRGCWLPFRGPSQMAHTGMCEHNDVDTVPSSDIEMGGYASKLSQFPPRPSNMSQKQSSQPIRPVGDLWLSIMCALGEGEAELAYMMLDKKHASNSLGDACDNFDRPPES